MVAYARVTYAFLLSFATHVLTNGENITESCMYLYEKGVEAYLDNRFEACVTNFENALQMFKEYTAKLQNCRIKCQQEAELSEPLYPVNVDNLLFYERAVKSTLCLVRCKKPQKKMFDRFTINKETEKLFQSRKPYEYLHICYFQNKEYQKAASAAFTYLVSHPDDKIMSANLKHYSSLEGVDMSELVNFEAKDYVYLYIHGEDAYERKDWNDVVQNMEESLASYLQSEDECRALCEGPFDQGWYPDFIPAIANHFTYCLKCKQKCAGQLNHMNGKAHEDLLPSHYHFLQYAYFKMGNLRAACAAVASYLLFYPGDETMLENQEYYRKLPKAEKDWFTPRSEAVYYVQRLMYERQILKFIAKEFKFDKPPKDGAEALNYRVIMTEKQLQGPNRFVSEGLATRKECRMLVDIAKMFAILGDGYSGKSSPHTIMETFVGISIDRAALLVYIGLLDPKYLKLYLDLTERAKAKIQDFFKTDNLFFSYTHLVGRSPVPYSPANRTDLSHSIHADNCDVIDENHCEKSPPAYTWRDYSAIIFLNDDFDGGEFIFSADLQAEQIQGVVKPECGRMVAFSSGLENLHGVKAVKKGARYVIAVWLTHDVDHQEIERNMAQEVLRTRKLLEE